MKCHAPYPANCIEGAVNLFVYNVVLCVSTNVLLNRQGGNNGFSDQVSQTLQSLTKYWRDGKCSLSFNNINHEPCLLLQTLDNVTMVEKLSTEKLSTGDKQRYFVSNQLKGGGNDRQPGVSYVICFSTNVLVDVKYVRVLTGSWISKPPTIRDQLNLILQSLAGYWIEYWIIGEKK